MLYTRTLHSLQILMFITVIRAQCSVINVTFKLPALYEMLLASFILYAYRVAFMFYINVPKDK